MEYESYSPAQTEEVAAQIARGARPGTVICLNGELGAGKTAFAKGIAAGLGIDDLVTSPTFTIINEYGGGRLPLYHFDVYRVSAGEQMQDTGYEEYFYGDGVCVVEWASLVSELLPDGAITVDLEKDITRGEDFRLIRISDEGNLVQ